MRLFRSASWIHHWLVPLTVTVLGFAAIIGAGLIPAIGAIRDSVSAQALGQVNIIDGRLSQAQEEIESALIRAGTDITHNPERIPEVLERLRLLEESIESVAFVGPDGLEDLRVFATTSQGLGPRVHYEEYYFTNAKSDEVLWGDIRYTPLQAPVLPVSIGVVGQNGSLLGVIVSDISLSKLVPAQWLALQNGFISVPDQKGVRIISGETALVSERQGMLHEPVVQEIVIARTVVSSFKNQFVYINEAGNRTNAVGVPTVWGWGIVAEISEQSALTAERRLEWLALFFSLLTLAFLVLMLQRERDLGKVNNSMQHLLTESQTGARLLVQKDRELHSSNNALEETNASLQETARVLIRRDLELSQANERLEELDSMKSEFVSVAAHQLRTPLTGVRWSLKGLSSGEYGPITDDQKRVANDALKAISNATDLINDLLDIARIEGGRFGFAFKNQALAPIVEMVFEKMKLSAEGLTLTLLPIEAGIEVLADAERLSMALENVIENAVRYTPVPGSVSVSVFSKDAHVHIAITDTGIGIPKDEKARLFSKFFRAPNAVLLQTSGTGLGLYLVKNIIEKHKGSITIESEEGKGTTATVILPRVAAKTP